jgi:hypothetical protein
MDIPFAKAFFLKVSLSLEWSRRLPSLGAGASSKRDETALLSWVDWTVRLRGRAVASGEPHLAAGHETT